MSEPFPIRLMELEIQDSFLKVTVSCPGCGCSITLNQDEKFHTCQTCLCPISLKGGIEFEGG